MIWRTRYLRVVFLEIQEEAGYPPIRLVSRKTMEKYLGRKLKKGFYGRALPRKLMMWVNRSHPSEVELRDTIWHEEVHCLIPNAPEWLVEGIAYVLSGRDDGQLGEEMLRCGKTLKDIPCKEHLLIMIRGISACMNGVTI